MPHILLLYIVIEKSFTTSDYFNYKLHLLFMPSIRELLNIVVFLIACIIRT